MLSEDQAYIFPTVGNHAVHSQKPEFPSHRTGLSSAFEPRDYRVVFVIQNKPNTKDLLSVVFGFESTYSVVK